MSHLKEFEHLKIPLEAIKSATNNFSDESCIGKGGFGRVYKGEISHSKGHNMVALKRLDRAFGQGDPHFWKEIIMLSIYKHENIVSLLGFCDDDGEKILAYEYAPKKSLDRYLHNDDLTWVGRLKICIGAAHGLACLHNAVGTQLRVLHCDIKSSNILLDENWNAKISDFGLSKFGPANQQITFQVSTPVGTPGYVDPLYAEHGFLTKESDVYSFGVVLCEILCGRLCSPSLVGLVRQSYEQNTLHEIIYDNIKDEINLDSLKVYAGIAYKCLKRKREERPLMSEIVTALETALQCHYQIPNMYLLPTALEVPVLDIVKVTKQPIGILNVKVLKAAMKLKRVFRVFAPNAYVKLRLTKAELLYKKTNVIDVNVNPEWNDDFDLVVKDLDAQALEIVVCQVEGARFSKSWINVVPLKDLIPEERKTLTLDLFKNMDSKDSQNNKSYGQIMVEMMYQPITDDQIPTDFEDGRVLTGGGLLVVTIHEGEDLEGAHPLIHVTVQNDRRKTMPAKKSHDPVWKEEFTFLLEKPPMNEKLHLEARGTSRMDKLFGTDHHLGYVDIYLADVVKKKRTEETYRLKNSLNGRIHVELQWGTKTDQTQNMYLLPKAHEVPEFDTVKQPIGILNVKVVRAMMSHVYLSNTYVKLRLTKDELPSKKTNVNVDDGNPEWNEDFNLVVKDLDAQALEIEVCRVTRVWKDKSWINVVPLKDLIPEERKTLTLDLFKNMDSNDSQNNKSYGQILVKMMYQPITDDQIPTDFEDGRGIQKVLTGGCLLVVTIHEGEDLEGAHPLIQVTVQNDRRKTTPAKKSHDPVWKEEFTFRFEKPPMNEKLHLEARSTSRMDKLLGTDDLGHVDISLEDVMKKQRTKEIYRLKNSRNGQIHVELQWCTFS